MKKYIAFATLIFLPFVAMAQNKVLSSAPNNDSLPVKQLEANIDFLTRELDILHKKILALYPLYADIYACGTAGLIYAPGAAAYGSKCVPLSGPPFVSEIKATTGSTTTGDMSAYGSTPSARIQGFINANGCPTASGWHVCTDDEVIFALDNRVTGATNPTTIINTTDYWIRTLNPYRHHPTETPGSAYSTYSCLGWTSGDDGYRGAIFSGVPATPRFSALRCGQPGRVLCCR